MIEKSQVDNMLSRLGAIETRLADPATAADRKTFRALVREHTALKRIEERARRFFSLRDALRENREILDDPASDADLRRLAESESADLETAVTAAGKDLTVALLPERETERRSAIMEIRAGTGGEEASLFAGDLFRMYSKYVEGRGWKLSMVSASQSDLRGFKEVVFVVQGEGAYGALQYESGGHRVQRVPVTEASGRIHTSAATVAVFPEAEEEDDIEIKPDDVRVDIFCSSGPGGQSVNTTYSAIRLTHLPTGLVVQSQDERSQHRNKERAMAVLKSRLLDLKAREEEARKGSLRRSLTGSGDRSERIRTYNFPQNRLTDHRINLTLYSLDRVIEGDLDAVLTALRDHDTALRVQEELKQFGAA